MTQIIDVTNPRTGEVDYHLTVDEVAPAAERLRTAQADWRALGLEGRSAALTRLAAALTTHKDAITSALVTDTGRISIAAQEVNGVIGMIHGWIAQGPHLLPEQSWTSGRVKPHMKHATEYVPYTLVGVISPWNFPMTLSFIDTIPALLAGACVLVKPSEVTPRFIEPLRTAIAEAGLSDVLGFVCGDGRTGAALVGESDCICFTGSVETGKKVALAAASHLIPANLELGGKDPLIILPGSDIERATDLALRASVLATGQACQSIERVYVHADEIDAFTQALGERALAVPLAYPEETPGSLGPFIFPAQAEKVAAQIKDALEKGAQLIAGGKIENHGGGAWLRPTVLSGVTDDMLILQDETFGPVIPVIAYDTIEDAVRMANATEFGLSAGVFGPDEESCMAVAQQIVAGAVSIMDAALTGQYFEAPKNSFKSSGLGGSRMGADGFARFFRKKAYIANTICPLSLTDF
jgi:acyl-CoA reductase-like NAD-dependent aldehyde dehydrogenase